MNFVEKILYFLQKEMEIPVPYGWFHLLWIVLSILTIVILSVKKTNNKEKELKLVLGTYGVVALILETLKQLIWSFNYNELTNVVTWDYQWYAFPFQLCTTPIFVSLICLFLKEGKARNSLLSYLSYVTILGGLLTMLIPDSCFVSDILVNIHTMWLHCGSFVVSVYLLISNNVKINLESLKNAIKVFLIFLTIALLLNISIYNSGVLNGETFNMFYISPYFISSLPVFNIIQEKVYYVVYLIIYIWAIILGAIIVLVISSLIKMFFKKNNRLLQKNVKNA